MRFIPTTAEEIGEEAYAGTILKKHEETKGWCEFCDPIFGNGGWI
jgi:hypothetical protein